MNNNHDTDPELGLQVQEWLTDLGFETPMSENGHHPRAAQEELEHGMRRTLELLGLDLSDPSLHSTPKRYAKMLIQELTNGLDYSHFPSCTAIPNGTNENSTGAYDEMVLVRDIQVLSLCEHHLQTIDGYAHIGYIPMSKVLGLSKFARVTDFFARRPQVQERLTSQIYHALELVLGTPDIAVVIKATHFCMKARGALQHASTTQTNKMGGRFMTNGALRSEFLDALR